ncbi:MAG: hypothetical protein ABJN75_20235 [Hoeflea sp.]|uniref:hypothetical protein n=1 Tax=Hoeflea sp. TaxID=1940281 RepID=UPI003299C088
MAAVLFSVKDAETAQKAMTKPQTNFGEFLMLFPGGIELGSATSRIQDADA